MLIYVQICKHLYLKKKKFMKYYKKSTVLIIGFLNNFNH